MGNAEVTLQDRLGSIVHAMGYEFIGCQLKRQGRGALLRVYIDAKEGVTLDDCSRVSRQISAVLDIEDPIQEHYTLEISSPGLDRPLFNIAHYQNQIGKRLKIRLHAPISNCRNFTGTLLQIEGSDIHLLVDTGKIVIPFPSIEKANIVADIR
jgi:ribosome maturation factor RimP